MWSLGFRGFVGLILLGVSFYWSVFDEGFGVRSSRRGVCWMPPSTLNPKPLKP